MSFQLINCFQLLACLKVGGILLAISAITLGACPQETAEFHRLDKTRFYIYDKGGGGMPDKSMNLNWQEAKEKCSAHAENFQLASSLNKISTNAIIARNLEVLAQRLELKETVYWIDAIYNVENETYQWSNSTDIQYGNFFYQQPEPAGFRGHLKKHVHYAQMNPTNDSSSKAVLTEDQCLAYALPYRNNPMMGWQASWLEKDCGDRAHRRVLCESIDLSCEKNVNRDPHVLTEDKEYYFTDGNWIFANRRFIVNWKPRTKAEAEEYCSKYDLDLLTPVLDDNCLIPYLKVWAPVISTYQFWTSYSYHTPEQQYRNKNGEVQKGSNSIDMYHHMGKSHRADKQHCVTYQWAFEMINETRCNCDWMYFVLVPAKCENYVGTICQHRVPDNTRACDFQREWLEDFSLALAKTAVVEFGYKGSGFWRSTYKQTFGSRVCGDPARQMVDSESRYYDVDPIGVEFTYDYDETYWVVNENLFKYEGMDAVQCTVSVGTHDKSQNVFTRELRKVNCNEWHFYLCEFVI